MCEGGAGVAGSLAGGVEALPRPQLYESGTGGGDGGEKLPVEGNKHRDVWKRVAWNLSQDSQLGQYERAVYAALCGNIRESVL